MVGDISFGGWLKLRRRQVGLTQKELAFKAGCSVGTIRKIEADERRPSVQLATLLAQYLDIPAEQHEPFIAFARTEPYTAGVSFPILAPACEQKLAIPAAPQEAPAQPVKNNLPSAMTPFLGRDTELTKLDDLLNNLDRRLVTIIGPGGIGKTRLALAYAEQLVGTNPQSQYPQGIFLVNLAPLPKAKRMVLTLAETLNLLVQGGAQEKRLPKQ